FWQPRPEWYTLLLLPFLVGLYVAGTRFRETETTTLGEPLRVSSLLISALALLVTTFSVLRFGRPAPVSLPLLETCLAGVFALFTVDAWRTRRESGPVLVAVIFGLAGLAHLAGGLPSLPLAAPVWTLFALAAACILVRLAWRLDKADFVWLSLWPLLF